MVCRPSRSCRPYSSLALLVVMLGACWAALALAPPTARAGATAPDADPVDASEVLADRILVKFRTADAAAKPGSQLRELLGSGLARARSLRPASIPPGRPGGLERWFEIPVAAGIDVRRLARALRHQPEVEFAEPVPIYHTTETPPAGRMNRASGPGDPPGVAAVPNDPAWTGGTQDALAALQLEAAWDVIRGDSTAPVVCVVDGGTHDLHEDLAANMWVNPGEIPGNGIDDDANGFIDDIHGWNFRDDSPSVRGNPATPGNANHGTHTGGLLAAVTNNGIGVASASWNPRLMAVNASGQSDGTIAFGYSGVLYAADNGASIVSLSWGGTSGSQALQDIIDAVTAQGMLVVAAAGNNNSNVPFYPAAYRNVLAVANVWGQTGVRYSGPSGSNYGGWIDVAAPGAAIYSTFDMGVNNAYGSSTGTSMAAPVAAAVATLIKALHPTWGPLEVGEQLRVTCDGINAVNPGFEDLLGRGRVNALRAVTEVSPAVRLVSWTLADADGNGELNQGETVTVDFTAHNYLAGTAALTFSLSTASPYIAIVDGTENTAALPDDGETTALAAFQFTVAANAPPGTRADLRVDITDGTYSDFQYLPVVLEPVFETHTVNNLQVSLTGTGNVGWVGFAGGFGDKGDGFTFKGSGNVLFEGALLLGTGPGALSDAARSGGGEHTDFQAATLAPPTKSAPGTRADEEIDAVFDDAGNTSTPLGVTVRLHSLAYATPPDDDFVLVGYTIRNDSAAPFTDLRVGLFFDWDIDEDHFATNQAGFDASRALGYAWDATPGLPYVGILGLNGSGVVYSAVRNDGGDGQPFSLYDGFSKDEKWTLLSTGNGFHTAGPFDISNALATGPWWVAPGDSVTAWFALLAGDDLADLQANADRVRVLFADSVATAVDDDLPGAPPRALRLGPAVPNPFNPGTRLELAVDRTQRVRLLVYDVRGHRVRGLLDAVLPAGRHPVVWNGRDDAGRPVASGIYQAVLRSEDGVLRRRSLVLVR